MTDKTDLIIDMLQSHQEGMELMQRMIAGAQLVSIGGVEGIQEVAQTNPEVILTTIEMLTTLIVAQHESKAKLMEYWLESMDQTDQVFAMIDRFTKE